MKTISESINYLSLKWGLSNIRPLVAMSPNSNYVARVYSTRHKTDVVLKIFIKGTKELQALKLFNGNGYVTLLEYDQEYNGLLLENITPGNTLSTLFPQEDARSFEIMVELIKKMQKTDVTNHENEFETVADWLELLHTFASKKISKDLLHKAYQLSQILLTKDQDKYLLHGDLHHENILQCADNPLDSNSWVIIDPKGVIGPIEFEVIRFIFNPLPGLLQQHNPKEIIQRRIEQINRMFGFEKQRLLDWCFVQAVLSACWAEQGGGQMFLNYFIDIAKIVEDQLME